MLFCENCENLLTTITDNDNLKFLCKTCFQSFKSKPEDTLMLSVDLKESKTFYKSETFINLSTYDNLSKLIKKDCQNENCDETIIKIITINTDLQSIYLCSKCGYKFL